MKMVASLLSKILLMHDYSKQYNNTTICEKMHNV